MSQFKTIKGSRVPALGLGTFELTGDAGIAAIRSAIEIGYRHIDTAIRYGNEREVGTALRASGLPREDLFVTTKIWFDSLAPEEVERCTAESLDRLQLDHVDLLLVHWPTSDVPLGETLTAFAEQKAKGRTRRIGVSNFPTALLHEAIDVHGADLFCNQVEYHPFLSQDKVLSVLRRHDMLLTAYQPIARGKVFETPLLNEIGRKHGKSPAQISLRWLIQQENVAAIPRSSKVEHMRSNFEIFDFELDPDEMAAIDALRGDFRVAKLAWEPDWDTV